MDHEEHVARDNRRRRILGAIRANPGITLDKLARKVAGRIGDVQMDLAELEGEDRIYKDTCPGCRRPRWMVSSR